MSKEIIKYGYDGLISSIGTLLEEARKSVYAQVNQILVKTYWEIGKKIVEYEQKGKEKADYGSELLERLSRDLKLIYGRGFSKSNVYLMRLFYLSYQKFQTVSGKLSWSHYAEILGVSDELARKFYEKQCIKEGWSVRELKRQINSALFERLALSRDKKGVLDLSKKGHTIENPAMVIGSYDITIKGWNKNQTAKDGSPIYPLAIAGRKLIEVTDENGEIRVGDLLTSSSKRGKVMKCDDYEKCRGAIIGKAMDEARNGKVLALIITHKTFQNQVLSQFQY